MLVRIRRGQPEVKVTLVAAGREGRRPGSAEGFRLVVTPPPPPASGEVSRIIRKGWWAWPPVTPPEVDVYPDDSGTRRPALVYPAMGLDEEGSLVFRLDKLLWDAPCGRYVGRVEAGESVAATLDLELEPTRWTLDSVEVGP